MLYVKHVANMFLAEHDYIQSTVAAYHASLNGLVGESQKVPWLTHTVPD